MLPVDAHPTEQHPSTKLKFSNNYSLGWMEYTPETHYRIGRLRKEKLYANTVNVQLRTKNFEDTSHQKKLPEATDTTKQIYLTAKELLHEMYRKGQEIRLVGVRVDNLVETKENQISLFDTNKNEKQEKLDKVIDSLRNKYGYNSVSRATKMDVEEIVKFKKED